MNFTRRLAIDNPGVNNRMKLAAALVIKRDVVSIGVNGHRSHPVQKRFGKNSESIYMHAEISAIVNGLNHVGKEALAGASLYVYRVKKSGSGAPANSWVSGQSCPCAGCMSAIAAFKIKRVLHSTEDDQEINELIFG